LPHGSTFLNVAWKATSKASTIFETGFQVRLPFSPCPCAYTLSAISTANG
jgi:hypothetical protein